MGKNLKVLWHRISRFGVTANTDPDEVRRIILLNQVSIFVGIYSLVVSLPVFNPVAPVVGFVEFMGFLTISSIPFLNRIISSRITKQLLVLLVDISITTTAFISGYEVGDQLFFVLLVLGIPIIQDLNKLGDVILSFAITLGFVLLLELTDYNLFIEHASSNASERSEYTINFVVILIGSGLMGFYYFKLTHSQFNTIKKFGETQQQLNNELNIRQQELETQMEAVTLANKTLRRQEVELIKARDLAEEGARAKSEFLSTMSHEIRTPMNAVIGMTSLLIETELNEEQRDYVETVKLSGENLLTIINDILDFSKIESGKMELEMQDFETVTPVEDVFDLLNRRAQEKGIELIHFFSEEIPSIVNSDLTRLRQVLLNLVSNAIKFTDEGEILVSVKKKSETHDYITLEFRVEDTGIGIPADRKERLFQSFSQVDASTTRKYGGTGLGLAISKRLVELMGGSIGVESVEGEGSVFSFTIQARHGNTAKPKRRTVWLPNMPVPRILLVDDNRTNLRILQQQCANWGLETVATHDPREALPILREQGKIHLAILDMHMPNMDGISLAQAIRAEYTSEQLPLIMLSSLGLSMSDIEKALFNEILVKPARQSVLFNGILESLEPIDKELEKQTPIKAVEKRKPITNEKLKILLVEDNVVNQKVAIRILEKLGFSADVAANGIEAINAVEMIQYDLMFMDVQMPEMDGLTATREIRRRFRMRPNKPVIIAMTANAMQGDSELCLAAGMDDYLAKPVSTTTIEEKIRNWFGIDSKRNTRAGN